MEHLKKTISYLIFKIKDEHYALDVHSVLEVLENQKVTQVPNTPDHILGVVNFRGDILPILDLRKILNLQLTEGADVIIVLDLKLETHQLRIGAKADSVVGVALIPELSVEVAPDINYEFSKEFVEGVFRYEERFITILDISKVFTLENIVV